MPELVAALADVDAIRAVANRTALKAYDTTNASVWLSEAGREGLFKWDSAVPIARHQADTREGIYVAPSSGSAGAWVRQYDGSVSVKWFGTVADGVTSDSAAFVAAIALLKAMAVNANGETYKASGRLYVPPGLYYMGTTTLEITHTLVIEGDGHGFAGGSAPAILLWGTGCTGIRLQAHNTEGDHQISNPTHFSAAGSTIRGISLQSQWSSGTGPYHAIDANIRCGIRDVGIYNWEGNGIHMHATAGGGAGSEGNANCFAIERCTVYACKDGVYFAGADANAGNIILTDCSMNRGWGFNDESFLGNTYTGCHAAGNTSGPYRTTNLNSQTVIVGCYSEGGQPKASLTATTMVIGGQHGAEIDYSSRPAYLHGGSTGLVIEGETKWKKGDATDEDLGNIFNTLDSWGNSAGFRFRYRGNPHWGYASVMGNQASGLISSVIEGLDHSFMVNDAAVMDIDATGANLASGKTIRVGGAQVVGARGAAVADATDAASVITQLNTLLARLRAHGLIAT